ncbi:hypothetical protein ROBYS_34960 [Roseobacter sp. OBYS 0001]|nr:hypothetical protein ROBYS_34960 [Roseobacter sp. OBYS 0001]
MVSAATPDPNLFEGELGLICFLEKSQSFLKEARLADIEKIDGLWTAPAVLEIPGNGCFKYLETEELESFLSSYCILEDRPTE